MHTFSSLAVINKWRC